MKQEITDILNGVESVKISIVMQVNLTNYEGSRTEAVNKFRRAVNSYQNQIYKNTELIIVSDGCNRTHQIYNREFIQDPSIKFMFLDRNGSPLMYEQTEEGKYYRGFPRRAGVGIATGSLITYMDSDDYLLPEFAMTLMLIYNSSPESDWYINSSWYDSSDHNWEDSESMYGSNHEESIEIENIDGKWTPARMKPGKATLTPWLFMHKATCLTKWRDVIGSGEDSDFNRRLRSEYKNGYSFERPIYVRCHYTGSWDY